MQHSIENLPIPEGYKPKEILVNPVWANIFVVILVVPTLFVFGVPFYFIWQPEYATALREHGGFLSILGGFSQFIIVTISGIIMHELIHGVFAAKFASNGWKSVKFGVAWKYFMPYCTCKEPLTVRHYRIVAVMPTIILGVIPCIVALIIGSPIILLYGVIFIVSGGGDILIIWTLRHENGTDFMLDHPTAIGCYVLQQIA